MSSELRVFAPYRICPLGAHVDHQNGLISGFAIDKGVELYYRPTDGGIVELTSADFPGLVRFDVQNPSAELTGEWGDFARGAAYVLLHQRLRRGIAGQVRGSLPIGGLSSSAAVILCYLQALLSVNDVHVSAEGLIELALAVEKGYAGVNVGKLDPSCEVLSRRDHLLYMDTMDQSYELIPTPSNMRPYQLLVFYSGLSRKLGAGFNLRVDELRAASWYMKAMAGTALNPFAETRLRDVPRDVYNAYEQRLPEPFRRRARHFYTECERVRAGAAAWRAGDISAFGELVFQSGQSSIENYETGSEHLIELYNLLRKAPGVYGARFSGAGFKGCCVAIVDPAKADACNAYVSDRYLRKHPELRGAYSVHVARTGDGVGKELEM